MADNRAVIEIDADISSVESRLAELEARFKTTTDKMNAMIGTVAETSGSKKFGSFFDLDRRAKQLVEAIGEVKAQLDALNQEMATAGGDKESARLERLTKEYEALAQQLVKTSEAASGGDEKAAKRLEKQAAKTEAAYEAMIEAQTAILLKGSEKEVEIAQKTEDEKVAIKEKGAQRTLGISKEAADAATRAAAKLSDDLEEGQDKLLSIQYKNAQEQKKLIDDAKAHYDKAQQEELETKLLTSEKKNEADWKASIVSGKAAQKEKDTYDAAQQEELETKLRVAEKKNEADWKARVVSGKAADKAAEDYAKSQQEELATKLRIAEKKNEADWKARAVSQKAADKAAEDYAQSQQEELATKLRTAEKKNEADWKARAVSKRAEEGITAALVEEENKRKAHIQRVQDEIVDIVRSRNQRRLQQSIDEANEEIKNNDRILANAKKGAAQLVAEAQKSGGGLAATFKSLWAEAGKLQNVLAGAGLTQFAKDSVEAALAMNRVETTFAAVSGSASQAQHSMDLVRDAALQLGAPIEESARGLAQMTAAAKESGLSSAQVEKVWRSLLETGRVLNLSNQQINNSIYALIQMMSKGTVQSEELKRQLGDQIPGATQLAAKAMGVTTREFDKMLKSGQIMSDDFLPKFAAQLHETFGPGLEKAAQSAAANMDRIKNTFFLMKAEVGKTLFEGADVLLPDWLVKQLEERGLSIGQLVGRGIASGTILGLIGALKANAKDMERIWKEMGDEAAHEYVDAYIEKDPIGQIVDAQNQAGKELVDATRDLYTRAFHEGAKPIEEAIVALAEYEAAAQAAGGATAQQQGVIDASVKLIGNVYQALGPQVSPVLEEMANRLGIVTDATEEAADATSKFGDQAEKEFQAKIYDAIKALTASSKTYLEHAKSIDEATLHSERFKNEIKALIDQWDKIGTDPENNPLYQQLKALAAQLGVVSKETENAEKAADKEAKAQERLEKQHEKAAEKARKHAEAEAAAAARMLEAADAAKAEAEALVKNLTEAYKDLEKQRDELLKKTEGGVIGSMEDLEALDKVENDLFDAHSRLGEAQTKLNNINIGSLPALKGMKDELKALGINLDVARVPAEKLIELLKAMGEDEAAATVAGGNLANQHEKVNEILRTLGQNIPELAAGFKTMGGAVSGALTGLTGEAAQAAIGTIHQLSQEVTNLTNQANAAKQATIELSAGPGKAPEPIVDPSTYDFSAPLHSTEELFNMLSKLPPVFSRTAEEARLYDEIMKELGPVLDQARGTTDGLATSTTGLTSPLAEAAKATQELRDKYTELHGSLDEVTGAASTTADAFTTFLSDVTAVADDDSIQKVGDTWTNVLDTVQKATDGLVESFDGVSGAATTTADAFTTFLDDVKPSAEEAATGLNTLTESFDGVSGAATTTADAFTTFLSAVTPAADAAEQSAGSIQKIGDTWTNISVDAETATESMDGFVLSSGNAKVSAENLNAATAGLAANQNAFNASLVDTSDMIDQTTGTLKETGDKVGEFGDKLDKAADKGSKGAKKISSEMEAMQEATASIDSIFDGWISKKLPEISSLLSAIREELSAAGA